MSAPLAVVVTGLGVEVPGLRDVPGLLDDQPLSPEPSFDPVARLGRKGLLYKDRATKLALCAVCDALDRAGLPRHDLNLLGRTGVVVSSNLGNVDTVCRVMDALEEGGAGRLSPMDVPNASSNVIASSVAIRFGCRAVNLTLCNGATSGTDAVFLAASALRARRAERMLVVGVEPRNPFVEELAAASLQGLEPAHRVSLGEGAACVILETEAAADERGATVHGVIEGYTCGPPGQRGSVSFGSPSASWSIPPDLWLTPNQEWPAVREMGEQLRGTWPTEPATRDLSASLGELYGALGVFQCVAACLWLEREASTAPGLRSVLATTGGWGDGMASLFIRSRPSPAATS